MQYHSGILAIAFTASAPLGGCWCCAGCHPSSGKMKVFLDLPLVSLFFRLRRSASLKSIACPLIQMHQFSYSWDKHVNTSEFLFFTCISDGLFMHWRVFLYWFLWYDVILLDSCHCAGRWILSNLSLSLKQNWLFLVAFNNDSTHEYLKNPCPIFVCLFLDLYPYVSSRFCHKAFFSPHYQEAGCIFVISQMSAFCPER